MLGSIFWMTTVFLWFYLSTPIYKKKYLQKFAWTAALDVILSEQGNISTSVLIGT